MNFRIIAYIVGWDPITNTMAAPDDVWDEYLKANMCQICTSSSIASFINIE